MATTAEHEVVREQNRETVYGAPSPYAPEPPVTEVSILDILLVLARRRRFIVIFTLVCTAIGTLLAFTRTPVYTAKTVILPPQQSSSGAGLAAELSSLGALGSLAGGGLGLKNPTDQYVALFKSEVVENAMIQRFDLQRQYKDKLLSVARHDFEGNSKVAADTKTGLITISYTDKDPKRAALIANAYVDQYRHLSEHLAISEAAQRRLFFERQLLEAKNNLSGAEDALLKYQQSHGLVELNSQARSLIEEGANLRAQIAAKRVQIQGLETYAAPDNAALVQAQGELASLQAQIGKLGGSGGIAGDELIVPGGKVPAESIEYARHLRDVKYNETIFNILARQFEAAKLDEAREGALVQVVDPAMTPDWKSAPKRALWLAISFALGLIVSCGWVLWRAALRLLHRDPETDSKLNALNAAFSRRKHAEERRA